MAFSADQTVFYYTHIYVSFRIVNLKLAPNCSIVLSHSFVFAENPTEQFMYILFWGTASVLTLIFIYYYGREFVDNPKLALAKVRMDVV